MHHVGQNHIGAFPDVVGRCVAHVCGSIGTAVDHANEVVGVELIGRCGLIGHIPLVGLTGFVGTHSTREFETIVCPRSPQSRGDYGEFGCSTELLRQSLRSVAIAVVVVRGLATVILKVEVGELGTYGNLAAHAEVVACLSVEVVHNNFHASHALDQSLRSARALIRSSSGSSESSSVVMARICSLVNFCCAKIAPSKGKHIAASMGNKTNFFILC